MKIYKFETLTGGSSIYGSFPLQIVRKILEWQLI